MQGSDAVLALVLNRRSSVEQKLSYSFVTTPTCEDKRGLSSIRCGVDNGSTRDQQLCDGRVTLLRRHQQGSDAVRACVIRRGSGMEECLDTRS